MNQEVWKTWLLSTHLGKLLKKEEQCFSALRILKNDQEGIAVKDQSKVRGSTHRFYTYPAGFSPVFVEAAIQSLSKKNDNVWPSGIESCSVP